MASSDQVDGLSVLRFKRFDLRQIEPPVVRCVMRRELLNVTWVKKSLPDSLKPPQKTSQGGFHFGLARGPISGTDTDESTRRGTSCRVELSEKQQNPWLVYFNSLNSTMGLQIKYRSWAACREAKCWCEKILSHSWRKWSLRQSSAGMLSGPDG